MLQKVRKNIVISLGFAAIIYLGLSIYADYDSVLIAFKNFNWLLFPLLLLLSYSNYLIRFFKWHYYLHLIKVKISFRDSFAIFMSGLIMSVTPGKMGELLKSYLVKEASGEPIAKTAPVVFAERITDFISVVLLALIGAYVYGYDLKLISIVGLLFILIVLLVSNRTASLKVIHLFVHIKYLKKWIPNVKEAYESSYKMLKFYPLVLMTLLSMIAWFFECFGYYLILKSFGIVISLLWATFVYTFATIVGSITMLPAGLGVTDGSLTFFIIDKGFPSDIAVASTFIIRAVTLWFAVLIGSISVFYYKKRFNTLLVNNYDKT